MAEEKISFLDFLRRDDIENVQIPRIQRDYVQGGKDDTAKDIRAGFLDDLQRAVSKKQKVSLNFIYGMKQDKGFLPLDGQQRLTTLFLLHWYGAVTRKRGEERNKIIELLKKFSYQTRLSSKDFCDLLLNEEKIIDGMAGLTKEMPSTVITGDPSYSRFWRYDPTVDSMLTMLDAIHEKFKDIDAEKWQDLFEQGSELINFFAYELTDSQSPDDLYVKMNARGKHLTHFENVKARLQQWMDGMDENFQKQWKHNMDGQWSMFFWRQEQQRESKLSAGEEKPSDPDPARRLIDGPFWIFLNRVSLFAFFRNNPKVLEVLREKSGKVDDNDPEKPTFDRGRDFLDTLRLNDDKKTDYVSPKCHRDIFYVDDDNVEHQKFAYQLISSTLNTLVKLADEGKLDNVVHPKWPADKNKATTAAAFFWGSSCTWSNLVMIWAFAGYCQKFYDQVENIDTDKLAHWMQFCFQVSDDVDAQDDVANAVSMVIMCLDKMKEANETDIHKFLGQKYESYHENDEPFARWHYSKTNKRDEIYNRFFDQKIPAVGEISAANSDKLLRFNAATILDEAFKAYLRCRREDSVDWEDLLSKLEADNRLHGRIQGIISENDANDQLLKNARARYNALKDDKRFASNSEDFVTLVNFSTTEPNMTLDFSSSASWGQGIKNADVAEAVCKVLLPPRPTEAAKAPPEWARVLNDHPELITEWGRETHRLHAYKGDGMYIFKKGNIASGAIVLRPEVHAGLKRFAEFHYPGVTMPDEFSGFYICETPGDGGGEFCRVTLKSIPAGAVQAETDGDLKNRTTLEKTVVVDSHNGIWVVGQEDQRVTWDELANYDSVGPEKQEKITKRLNEIFAQPNPDIA